MGTVVVGRKLSLSVVDSSSKNKGINYTKAAEEV